MSVKLYDPSGIGLPERRTVRVAYFVTNDRGERLRIRGANGLEKTNEFADELSALEMAAEMAESDAKFAPWSRSLYMISKGIVRDAQKVAVD